MHIAEITSRQIFDSRGNPTVETDVTLTDGSMGRASAPSGASTGQHEAVELRDGGEAYGGLGVETALMKSGLIKIELIGLDAADQTNIDRVMIDLDGTPNKSWLGANAILPISLAVAKAEAVSEGKPFYQYVGELAGTTEFSLPMPMVNILNGGKHAKRSVDIQETMIVPVGASTFAEAQRWSSEIFHRLGEMMDKYGYTSTVGDEGGYAPQLKSGKTSEDNEFPIKLVETAITSAKYVLGEQVALALDVAASELTEPDDMYYLRHDKRRTDAYGLIEWYRSLAKNHPIVSIEDGLDQNDWAGWTEMTKTLDGIQIVGDDLLVTNPKLIQKGINEKAATAVLVKPNQIGTLTETIAAVQLAKKHGWGTIMSHRSGETEDTSIAHLAVGLNTGQIKTGSFSRSERLAKYNELTRIAEHLGDRAVLATAR